MRTHLLIGVALLLAGCGYRMPAAYSEPVPRPSAPEAIRVGTARVDITPPPGVSTFGHASDSLVTDGVWTRLYCRVFAFETASGERLAIVPCDLAAMSTLLQRAVADHLDGVLPATRLMMSATHTHAGPAHYFDGLAYSNALSTHLPGFDPRFVEWLAARVADGVKHAFHDATPASLHWAHYDEGDPPDAKQGMWGLTWNRGLRAHDFDPRDRNRRKGPIWPPPPGLTELQSAIDPALHVLRIDPVADGANGQKGPLGVLTFFAMHPTVLSHENRALGGDTHGVVARDVERRLRAKWPNGPEPIVGVVNTNEGNISPVWVRGTRSEAIDIGRKIADRVEALMNTVHDDDGGRLVRLDVRYREVDLPLAVAHEGKETGALCEVPEPGESFAHGACDHPSTFSSGLLFPGEPYGRGCQFPKRGLAGQLAILVSGANDAFPRRVPLALVRLDDTLISFVPAELTIAAGHAVNQEVRRASGGAVEHAVVAGLSNGNILYVTTRDEFAFQGDDGGCEVATSKDPVKRQAYEGSSDLYGPWTGPFLAEQFGILARSLLHPNAKEMAALDPPIGRATDFSVSPGFERPRLAEGTGSDEPRVTGDAPAWLCTLHRERVEEMPTLCFQWTGPVPGSVPKNPGPWLELRSADKDAATGVDDRGFAFLTQVRTWDPPRSVWSALIRPDNDDWVRIGPKRKVVVSVNGKNHLVSSAFSSQRLPPECSPEQATWCGSFDDPVATFFPYPSPATPAPGRTP